MNPTTFTVHPVNGGSATMKVFRDGMYIGLVGLKDVGFSWIQGYPNIMAGVEPSENIAVGMVIACDLASPIGLGSESTEPDTEPKFTFEIKPASGKLTDVKVNGKEFGAVTEFDDLPGASWAAATGASGNADSVEEGVAQVIVEALSR